MKRIEMMIHKKSWMEHKFHNLEAFEYSRIKNNNS